MPRRNQGPRLKWLSKRTNYYIVWTENGRSKERSTGTDNREEAEAALSIFLAQRFSANGPKAPDHVLVTDILSKYAVDAMERIAAPERLGYAIAPLAEFWQGKSVAQVNSSNCRMYVGWRNRSDGTIRRELGVLRAAINHAHQEGILTRPVSLSLPAPPPSKSRWLTRHEMARLLWSSRKVKKAKPYLGLFLLIAFRTGQRKEAILSLRWSQVDLQNGLINWNPPDRVQTKKRRPRAPIPSRLLPHLIRAYTLFGSETGYVVSGSGFRVKDIKRSFASACQIAELDDVTPHTLRHTCATWLMQRGVDKWEICGFLGMTMETLERVYGHHHPEYLKNAATAF